MAPVTDAPPAISFPVPVGTSLVIDPEATFYAPNLVGGGAPWRLLRLSPAASAALMQWRDGGVVAEGEEELARTLVSQGIVTPQPAGGTALDDVTVVVPVRDNAEGLDRLLDCLTGLRVTVVDDGSVRGDDVDQIVAAHRARVVRHEQSLGPAAARNTGLRLTASPFVWFLDADVTVTSARFVAQRLLGHFHDPLVGAAAPRVMGAEGPSWRERFERRHSPLDMGATSSLVAPLSRVPYVPSAALMVRRVAMGTGFDEALTTGEDVDLVWRLADRGWLVRYDTAIVVEHEARSDWPSWWRQRVGYGQSAAALAQRHGDRLAPVRSDAWTLATWLLIVTGRSRWAAAVTTTAQRALAAQLPTGVGNPEDVAGRIAIRGIIRSGGPLARSVVRSYGPLLVLAALHPKLRRVAVVTLAAGTAWRLRATPQSFAEDLPLAVADDAAYATGLWRGAIHQRAWRAVTPKITLSTAGLKKALTADPLSLTPWRRPRSN